MALAAAAPDKNVVGRLHNGGLAQLIPILTTVSAAINPIIPSVLPANTKPAAANKQAIMTCQILSTVKSECRDHKIIAMTETDGGIAVNWALDGRGILLRAQWDVEQHIQSGRLIPLMKNFDTPDADIYAVYTQRHKGSARVKALIEFAVSTFTKK